MARKYIDDFESGNLNNWIKTGTGTATVVSSSPIAGSYSCKLTTTTYSAYSKLKNNSVQFVRGDSIEIYTKLVLNADSKYGGDLLVLFMFDEVSTVKRGYSIQCCFNPSGISNGVYLCGHADGEVDVLGELTSTKANNVYNAMKLYSVKIVITTTATNIAVNFISTENDMSLGTLSYTGTAYEATTEFSIIYDVMADASVSTGDAAAFLIDEVNPNTPPTVPGVFTSPTGVLQSRTNATTTWGASTDDVGVTGYKWSYSIDGGAYSSEVNGVSTSRVLSIPVCSTIQFRVRAYDADGACSSYRYSNVYTVVVKTQIGTFPLMGKHSIINIPLYDPNVGMNGKNMYRAFTANGKVGCFEVQDITGNELIRLTGKTKIRGIKR
jgi:hypothetical protein